jgi:hypothetical protein
MALTLKGRVVDLTPPVSNEYNGRTYCKQNIVLEFGEDEPSMVAFEFDPDRKQDAASAIIGEDVEVSFKSVSFESKKERGTYFTTNKLYRITFLNPRVPVPAPAPAAYVLAPAPTATAPAEIADESSELPF